MSVVIVLPNGTDWFKANWVFRQLAQDVSSRYQTLADVCKALELAQAVGSLDLKGMDEKLCSNVMEAIKTVAEETISGAIDGWRPHDPRDHAMYCEALGELAKPSRYQRTIWAC